MFLIEPQMEETPGHNQCASEKCSSLLDGHTDTLFCVMRWSSLYRSSRRTWRAGEINSLLYNLHPNHLIHIHWLTVCSRWNRNYSSRRRNCASATLCTQYFTNNTGVWLVYRRLSWFPDEGVKCCHRAFLQQNWYDRWCSQQEKANCLEQLFL